MFHVLISSDNAAVQWVSRNFMVLLLENVQSNLRLSDKVHRLFVKHTDICLLSLTMLFD